MKRIIFSILMLVAANLVYGQHTLSGRIIDKADSKPLTNASIVILNQDSIMQQFTRADEDGKFSFKSLIDTSYLLIVSYPKYELISKKIKLEGSSSTLAPIALSSQANLIEEVVIQQRLPIRIKGDTLEYDAGSFETEKNAKLEDLLRRLPGLSVSGDGKITANGKSVSKVLIDGEEFFGYDPKIAIRNIRADAVDKVQVYEKKSKEAELTGIDDGVREVTVNAVLKEEARKGIFGNAEALAGTDNLYTGSLFAAKFNKTERIGVTANTNNMGAGMGREGGLRMNSQITGNPRSTSIGTNYENQFFQKKVNFNGNYNFNSNGNNNEKESFNKQIVSDNVIEESENKSKTSNSSDAHGIRSDIRYRIDSTSNMEINIGANFANNYSSSESQNYTTQNGDAFSRIGDTTNTDGQTQSNDIRINYRKRLNKRGSSLNFHFNNSYNKNYSKSIVDQTTIYYVKGDTTILNQDRINNSNGNNISGQIQYSDRISNKINYSLGYNISNSTNKTLLEAFNQRNSNNPVLDIDYSQDQKTVNTSHGMVANINYFTEKISVNLSNRTNFRDQSLRDDYRNIDLDRTFWDNDINMNANYRISNRKNLGLNYQNNFNIPSFGQLQELQPQTNPLFEQKGNPDLKRSNNNSFRLNYHTMSLLKGTSWNMNADISFTTDPIVNQRSINTSTGVTTSSYINIMGRSSWRAGMNSNFNKPVFDRKAQFNIFGGLNYNNGFSFIKYGDDVKNQQYELNNEQTTSLSTGIGINEQDSKGLDYDFNWRISADNQRNSLRKEFNYTSINTSGSGFFKYFLPKKFNVSSNINYSLEGPTKFYNKSLHQFYVNAEISKKLLSNESLTASIKGFDIFNTYNNINRSSSETGFSQSSQQILTRYVLVGLKWDFNKNLGKKKEG
ncbi:outer membrane beta-barrel protein [Sphingobacterium yanglingense]|uniref:Carboxypeptidase-like protein n=1 Tax=Sphingobacterium yanglingense TaxID=1437280 RepID=A0A4R6W898_9SPHI|nr:outer membrane beta-barrel protein [Sphingobacterium yanglingense]TDQ75246.1 carboxypeptidase-like protein [Sphingobacterium yanglingense]